MMKKTLMTLATFSLALSAMQAWARPVPGTIDLQWHAGAPDCAGATWEPLQVHAYEPRTYVLRQNPCAHFEANFMYLLVGSGRALLIDTGAVAEPDRMPLADTVLELLPVQDDGSRIPLIVARSHGHRDHRLGDAQFMALPSVQVVPADGEGMRTFFRLDDWPRGSAALDLGERTVHVLPVPGHHPDHLAFYDDRTALLFTGDFLLPGRLLVDDLPAYRESAARLADFIADRPVAHVLGGHIELDVDGHFYPRGATHHPGERPLALAKDDVLALPAALEGFNGFHARHANFSISNPVRNLMAVVVVAAAVLALAVWGMVWAIRRRRTRRRPGHR